MSDLVFLDIETTGLLHVRHQVWEIAYAVGNGPILTSFVEHSLVGADPKALEMNGYYKRYAPVPAPQSFQFEGALQYVLAGATIVAANPAFDAGFLETRWGAAPWHYRLWDIEAYAAGVLNLEKVEGLKNIRDRLIDLDWDIPEPNHTARVDVHVLRESFWALRSIAAHGVRR